MKPSDLLKTKKSRVATVGATTALIVIITTSLFLAPESTSILPSFEISCDNTYVTTKETVTCGITGLSTIAGHIWDFHDETPLEAYNTTTDIVTHSFDKPGTYLVSVVGFSNYNLSDVQTVEITVVESQLDIDISANSTEIFEDEPLELVATGDDLDQFTSIMWSFGDGNTATGLSTIHQFQYTGNYTVELLATSTNGLQLTAYQNITVQNFNPIAHLDHQLYETNSTNSTSGSSTTIFEDELIQFSADNSIDSLSDISSLKYLWNFGNGRIATGMHVNHSYTRTGIYDVQLTVMDDDGDKGTSSVTIEVGNIDPEIENILTSGSIFEGETFTFISNYTETSADVAELEFDWEHAMGSWLATAQIFEDGVFNDEVLLTDNQGSTTNRTISELVQNLPPSVSLINVFSDYNASFAIKGRKGNGVEINLFQMVDGSKELLINGSLIREPGDPWYENVTFGIEQIMTEQLLLEVIFDPGVVEEDGGEVGSNPVEVSFNFEHFDEFNDYNYSIYHTFNLQQPDTYNWTQFLNPLEWLFPVNLEYHVFDPGHDNVTIITTYGNSTYYHEVSADDDKNLDKTEIISVQASGNTSAIYYYAVDSNGAESDHLISKISTSNNISVFDPFAPVAIISSPSWIYEDTPLDFSLFLTNLPNLYSQDLEGNTGNISIFWSFGNQKYSTDASPTIMYDNPGNYLVWVKITDGNFTSFDSRIIEVKNIDPIPSIIGPFGSNGSSGELNEDQLYSFNAVSLNLPVIDQSYVSYLWDMGDGSFKNGDEIQHRYPNSGWYTITLLATDEFGASTTVTSRIEVINLRPKISDEFDNIYGTEDELLRISATFQDSRIDVFDLSYNWRIFDNFNDFSDSSDQDANSLIGQQTGQTTDTSTWYLPDGQYVAEVEVTDQEGLKDIHRFVVHIDPVSPIISVTDYTIYGQIPDFIDIPFSVTNSKYSENYTYCISLDSDITCDTDLDYITGYEDGIDYFNVSTQAVTIEGSHVINAFINYNGVQRQTTSNLIITLDSDGDQLPDSLETLTSGGTDPFSVDTDGDNIIDPFETEIYQDPVVNRYATFTNIFFDTNPTLTDTDGDGIPDGYFNGIGELSLGTDPTNPDTDGDGISDGTEIKGWQVLVTTADFSSVLNFTSDPLNPDTDGDGLLDGEEFQLKSNPRISDTDNDMLSDFTEQDIGTSAFNYDTDSDGLSDHSEVSGYEIEIFNADGDIEHVNVTSDPMSMDSDGDGITDLREKELMLDATSKDTDRDNLQDNDEINLLFANTTVVCQDTSFGFTFPVFSIEITYINFTIGIEPFTTVISFPVFSFTVSSQTITFSRTVCSEQIANYASTKAYDADSDGDGLIDGVEVNGFNITLFDPSGATFSEGASSLTNDPGISQRNKIVTTNPLDYDSDNDGLGDYTELFPSEVNRTSDPSSADADGDGIVDSEDPVPLVTEYTPPGVSNINIEYDIPAITAVENVVSTINDGLGIVNDLILGNESIRAVLFDLIKDVPERGVINVIDDYLEEILIEELKNQNVTRNYDENSFLFNSLSLTTLGFDRIWERVDIPDVDINQISHMVNLDDAWNAITAVFAPKNILSGDFLAPVREYIKGLLAQFRSSFMSDIADRTQDGDGDSGETGLDRYFDFSFSISIEFKKFLGVPYAIKDIDLDGDFSFNFEQFKKDALSVLEVAGSYAITWVDSVLEILGVDDPTLNVEFDVTDQAGIADIYLYVNSIEEAHIILDDTDEIYNDYRFEWSGNVSDISSLDGGDAKLDPVNIEIVAVDINGNTIEISKSTESYTASFGSQLYAAVSDLIIVQAVTELLTAGFELYQAGAEVAQDFVDTVIEIGNLVVDAVIDTFLSKLGDIMTGVFYPARAVQNYFYDSIIEVLNSISTTDSNQLLDNSLDLSIIDETINFNELSEHLEENMDEQNDFSEAIESRSLDISSFDIVKQIITILEDFDISIENISETIFSKISELFQFSLNEIINENDLSEFENIIDYLILSDYSEINGLQSVNLTNFQSNSETMSELALFLGSSFENIELNSSNFDNYLLMLFEIISKMTDLINSENPILNSLVRILTNFLGGMMFIADPSANENSLSINASNGLLELNQAIDPTLLMSRWISYNSWLAILESSSEFLRDPITIAILAQELGPLTIVTPLIAFVLDLIGFIVSQFHRAFVENQIYSHYDRNDLGFMLLIQEAQNLQHILGMLMDAAAFLAIFFIGNPISLVLFGGAYLVFKVILIFIDIGYAVQSISGMIEYFSTDLLLSTGFFLWTLQIFLPGILDEVLIDGLKPPIDIILDVGLIVLIAITFRIYAERED